ncbi:MAG: TlpA family protein disulfide reductase [Peptococcaceae bacterium]|nr:TlpA family protein disulfide reductase [Peptococcaceae bacterium]
MILVIAGAVGIAARDRRTGPDGAGYDSGQGGAFEQPPVGIGVGQTAPDFTLSLRGGGSVSLWDLRGKPVLLNVSATWCPPCQGEFPEIQAVYKVYGDRAVILGIDIGETESEVDGYYDRSGYTYPIAYDPYGAIGTDYNVEFIPQTWVIDANGVIVDYIPGAADYDAFSASLDQALGE